jgi:hypothetical protein
MHKYRRQAKYAAWYDAADDPPNYNPFKRTRVRTSRPSESGIAQVGAVDRITTPSSDVEAYLSNGQQVEEKTDGASQIDGPEVVTDLEQGVSVDDSEITDHGTSWNTTQPLSVHELPVGIDFNAMRRAAARHARARQSSRSYRKRRSGFLDFASIWPSRKTSLRPPIAPTSSGQDSTDRTNQKRVMITEMRLTGGKSYPLIGVVCCMAKINKRIDAQTESRTTNKLLSSASNTTDGYGCLRKELLQVRSYPTSTCKR